MKLKKSEITLNEKDSLKDMLYFERALAQAYEGSGEFLQRKEAVNEKERLLSEALNSEKRLQALLTQADEKSL